MEIIDIGRKVLAVIRMMLSFAVLLAAVAVGCKQWQGEAPTVDGTIQGTRIVPDHAIDTKWGSEVTWKAEYRVGYTVKSQQYMA